MEVHAVQVDDVDALAREHPLDRGCRPRACRGCRGLVDAAVHGGRLDEPAGGGRPLTRDHDRAVAEAHEAPVEKAQHLLRAARGVRTDRRQRVGDAQDREAHRAPTGARPSSRSAPCASCPPPLAGEAPRPRLVEEPALVRRAAEVVRRRRAEPLAVERERGEDALLRREARDHAPLRLALLVGQHHLLGVRSGGDEPRDRHAARPRVVQRELDDARDRRGDEAHGRAHREGGRVVVGVAALVRRHDDEVRPLLCDEPGDEACSSSRGAARPPGRLGTARACGRDRCPPGPAPPRARGGVRARRPRACRSRPDARRRGRAASRR